MALPKNRGHMLRSIHSGGTCFSMLSRSIHRIRNTSHTSNASRVNHIRSANRVGIVGPLEL